MVRHRVDLAAVAGPVAKNAREVAASHDIGLGRVRIDDELGDRASGWGRLGEGASGHRGKPGCDPGNGADGAECAARHAKERPGPSDRSEEHTSELQSLMRSSYAVFCLKKKKHQHRRISN